MCSRSTRVKLSQDIRGLAEGIVEGDGRSTHLAGLGNFDGHLDAGLRVLADEG